MIAPLLAALLAGLAQPAEPPRIIVVRPAPGVQTILPVEPRGLGAERYVRADRLAQAFDGSIAPIGGGEDGVRLRLGEVVVEVVTETPYARVGDDVVPMATAAVRDGDRVWIPVQLVTDVLPRAGRGLLYDQRSHELRVFSDVASSSKPAAPEAKAPEPKTPEPRTTESKPTAPPAVAAAEAVPSAPARRVKGAHLVVVDAGHGGIDSGMHGSGGDEKAVTLGIARQLDAALRARNIGVIMTRSRDTLVSLADRGRIANQQKGELFISIHVNAANPSWRNAASFRGFETYFLADAKSEDARQVAVRENESVKFESGPAAKTREDPLGFILSDMAQNENQRESSRFAALVQRRLSKVHPGPSHGVKQAGFVVLYSASMPAVLVEVGFGTNADDAAFISGQRGQRVIAEAIADAAVEYLTRSERAGGAGEGTR